MSRFNDVRVDKAGVFAYDGPRSSDPDHISTFVCAFDLFLIREAWNKGMDVEDLADGFGPGEGTHGDWSGIRDSTRVAKDAMLERALNYLFT